MRAYLGNGPSEATFFEKKKKMFGVHLNLTKKKKKKKQQQQQQQQQHNECLIKILLYT